MMSKYRVRKVRVRNCCEPKWRLPLCKAWFPTIVSSCWTAAASTTAWRQHQSLSNAESSSSTDQRRNPSCALIQNGTQRTQITDNAPCKARETAAADLSLWFGTEDSWQTFHTRHSRPSFVRSIHRRNCPICLQCITQRSTLQIIKHVDYTSTH